VYGASPVSNVHGSPVAAMTTRHSARRPKPAKPSGTQYASMSQVCERYGDCSPITIERRLQNDPRFPRPLHFGKRMRLWKISELEAYERTLVVAKEAETAA